MNIKRGFHRVGVVVALLWAPVALFGWYDVGLKWHAAHTALSAPTPVAANPFEKYRYADDLLNSSRPAKTSTIEDLQAELGDAIRFGVFLNVVAAIGAALTYAAVWALGWVIRGFVSNSS